MILQENQTGMLLLYNTWASRRITDQIKTLTQEEFVRETGGSFPSLRLTLVHLLEADYLWLTRWQDQPLTPLPGSWDTGTAASASAIWIGIQEEIEDAFRAAHRDVLSQPLHFVTKAGTPMQMPWWQTVAHMVNHGTYHRGQLANMIRTMGHQPVGTDMFVFFAENNQIA